MDAWLRNDAAVGRYVFLRLTPSNRLDETLVTDRVTITRPKGARLSLGGLQKTSYASDDRLPEKGASNVATTTEEIAPYGSFWDAPMRKATHLVGRTQAVLSAAYASPFRQPQDHVAVALTSRRTDLSRSTTCRSNVTT
jgi:hypothetical protein